MIGPQEKEKRKLAAPLELLAKEEKWKGILRSWRFLNLVYGTTPCAGQVATLLFFHCPVRWPFIFVVVVVFCCILSLEDYEIGKAVVAHRKKQWPIRLTKRQPSRLLPHRLRR